MRWSFNLERSYSAALWLFGVAFLVFAMVVVGGATRLTGSGLSIVEWRPVTGILPPLSDHGWAVEFGKYQHIPQYRLLNRDISIDTFKGLYWWEWGHRLLGRVIGAAFLIPFLVLLYLRRIPDRLVWRCWVLLGLGGLQGFIGWWMVSSGLESRIYVAPERLTVHLLLALTIFSGCVWTGLEAWFGKARSGFPPEARWRWGALALLVLTVIQIKLGALVAGNQGGLVDADWPLMGGKVIPVDYAPKTMGLYDVLAHTQIATQFNHRLTAYVLLVFAVVFAALLTRAPRVADMVKRLAQAAAAAILVQAMVGVSALWLGMPLGISLFHQAWAVVVLSLTVSLSWRIRRA